MTARFPPEGGYPAVAAGDVYRQRWRSNWSPSRPVVVRDVAPATGMILVWRWIAASEFHRDFVSCHRREV